MKFRSLGVAAVALLLPFAAVACGGGKDDNDSGDRLTVAEIKVEITETIGADGGHHLRTGPDYLEWAEGLYGEAAHGRVPAPGSE